MTSVYGWHLDRRHPPGSSEPQAAWKKVHHPRLRRLRRRVGRLVRSPIPAGPILLKPERSAFYPNVNSTNKVEKPFSKSAAKRDSVLALGSIEHLQHYFTKTGLTASRKSVLIDGRGTRLIHVFLIAGLGMVSKDSSLPLDLVLYRVPRHLPYQPLHSICPRPQFSRITPMLPISRRLLHRHTPSIQTLLNPVSLRTSMMFRVYGPSRPIHQVPSSYQARAIGVLSSMYFQYLS